MANPTIYLSVKHPLANELGVFPSAGPRPNITGMRKLFYGKNARLIKCGSYLYKVNETTYQRALAASR